MGIPGLWDMLGDGDLVPLAQLATEFYEKHGRPYRIAVDEAGWRFNNLTEQQVLQIQAIDPAAHPIEKATLHRVLKLLRLNIELVIVFDGQKRPSKRGKRGGTRVDFGKIDLTVKMLGHLKVLVHRAPGEAEAECARLQQEGIVDAVWSDDGDTLMFGCTVLLRTHYAKGKENGPKSQTHVRVYRSATIAQTCKLDQHGMMLIALMSGGDYDGQGIQGCGPKLALKAAKAGLGRSLCNTPDHQLPLWREEVQKFLDNRGVEVPYNWPDPKILNYYKNPAVSDFLELNNVRRVQGEWNSEGRNFLEPQLRTFLNQTFNFQRKAYNNHILPVLLVKALRETQPGMERANNFYEIEIAATKAKKTGDDVSYTRKITFNPQSITTLDLIVPPDDEDWSKLATKAGPFDPLQRVECEILECMLRRSVPQAFEALEAKKSAKGKSKAKGVQSNDGTPYGTPQASQRTQASQKSQGSQKNRKSRKRNSPDDANDASTEVERPAKKTATAEIGEENLSLSVKDTKKKSRKTTSPNVELAPTAASATPQTPHNPADDAPRRKKPVFKMPTPISLSLVPQITPSVSVPDGNFERTPVILHSNSLAAQRVAVSQLPDAPSPASLATNPHRENQWDWGSVGLEHSHERRLPQTGTKADPISLDD